MKQITDPNGAIIRVVEYAFYMLHYMDHLPQDQEFIDHFDLWRNTEVDLSSELEISQDNQRKRMGAMIEREAITTEDSLAE